MARTTQARLSFYEGWKCGWERGYDLGFDAGLEQQNLKVLKFGFALGETVTLLAGLDLRDLFTPTAGDAIALRGEG